MPKHEKGTPKEIANRCKSKGLQKLRWYCEMCQKQCRDQNGFKCHLMSESHQRQLLLFAENQKAYLREFSREFESNFMHILRHTFGTKRIRANEVYQEYIKDKKHIHMNATVWHTLTGFVLYLGESGKCKIDENEKGWHIQYIDQEEVMRKQKAQKKAKNEKDDEDRMNELLKRRMEKALENCQQDDECFAPKEFIRNDGEVIKFSFGSVSKAIKSEVIEEEDRIKPESTDCGGNGDSNQARCSVDVKPFADLKPFNILKKGKTDGNDSDRKRKNPLSSKITVKKTALDELREEEERIKEQRNRKDYWLRTGIIVKFICKALGPEYYKAKGEVVEVIDKYKAQIKFNDGTVVKVDQEDLETVIPALNREMWIVNGAYRGEKAVLLEILEDKYMMRLKIAEGTRNGRVVDVAYEDASKKA